MTIKIGINGMGRIGRMIVRSIFENHKGKIIIKHINNRSSSEVCMNLLKYDSVHGKFNADIKYNEKYLFINKKKISYSRETELSKINWKKNNVDIVLECTGKNHHFVCNGCLNHHVMYFVDAESLKRYAKHGGVRCVAAGELKCEAPVYADTDLARHLSDATFSLVLAAKNQVAEQKINGGEILNYAAIVKKYFSVSLDKSQTNSNWLKRPLSDEQIKYALDDIDFLIEIYNYQVKSLSKINLKNKAVLDSEKEANLGNQSLKKIRLKKIQKKFSKRNIEIFIWREDLAKEGNIPPAYIFKDKHLKKLSKIDPKDNQAKRKIMTIVGDTNLTENFISTFL